MDVADEQPDSSFIIPFKLDDCEVPERLKHWQWIDYSEDKAKGYNNLLKAIQRLTTEAD